MTKVFVEQRLASSVSAKHLVNIPTKSGAWLKIVFSYGFFSTVLTAENGETDDRSLWWCVPITSEMMQYVKEARSKYRKALKKEKAWEEKKVKLDQEIATSQQYIYIQAGKFQERGH